MVDDTGTVVVEVVVDEVDSDDVDVAGADGGADEVDEVVGSDEGEAGVVVVVSPRPAGRDAAGGAGRTSRYSTSVKTNAATRITVDRRRWSRISALAGRECSQPRPS